MFCELRRLELQLSLTLSSLDVNLKTNLSGCAAEYARSKSKLTIIVVIRDTYCPLKVLSNSPS